MRTVVYGVKDGFSQPWQFNTGITYSSRVRQYVYDVASIWGQRAARILEVWRTPEM